MNRYTYLLEYEIFNNRRGTISIKTQYYKSKKTAIDRLNWIRHLQKTNGHIFKKPTLHTISYSRIEL